MMTYAVPNATSSGFMTDIKFLLWQYLKDDNRLIFIFSYIAHKNIPNYISFLIRTKINFLFFKYFRPRKGTPGSTPPTTATPTSPAPWTRKIFAGSSTTAGTLSSGYISECTRSSKSISPKIFRTTKNQQQKLFTRKIRMAHCFEERKKSLNLSQNCHYYYY